MSEDEWNDFLRIHYDRMKAKTQKPLPNPTDVSDEEWTMYVSSLMRKGSRGN